MRASIRNDGARSSSWNRARRCHCRTRQRVFELEILPYFLQSPHVDRHGMIVRQRVVMDGLSFVVCGYPDDLFFRRARAHIQYLFIAALRAERPRIRQIVDVGANIGITVALAAAIVPDARILAIEPSERTFAALQATIVANNLQERVIAVRALASSRQQILSFSDHSVSALSAVTRSGGTAMSATTVDALAAEHGFDAVDFVKIDTEGHDHEVLRGLAGIDQERKPTILAEYLPDLGPEQAAFLAHITNTYGSYLYLREHALGIQHMNAPVDGIADTGADVLFSRDQERFAQLATQLRGPTSAWVRNRVPRTLGSFYKLLLGAPFERGTIARAPRNIALFLKGELFEG